MKTDSSTTSYRCLICENGEMIHQRQEFETSVDGKTIIVPNVEMETCSGCKETVLTPKGSRQVSEYIEKDAKTIIGE